MADLSWWLDQVGRRPQLTPSQEIELGTAVQAWLNHPAGPDGCPPGIRRRGKRARDRFIEANLRLAVHWVSTHHHRLPGTGSTDDLIQSANLGLITAVERFDPARGYRFSTYAYWWIRQAVQAYCDRHGRAVAIPAQHHQHMARLKPVRQRLERELGRTPTRQELAAALNLSLAVLDAVIENSRSIASLDLVIDHESGSELGDMIASHDPSLEDLEDQAVRWRQAEQLRGMISRLGRRDRQALSWAWGLDGCEVSRRDMCERLGMNARRLTSYLQGLEQQLRGMAVQLVLVAVASAPTHRPPRVPAVEAAAPPSIKGQQHLPPRVPCRRRQRVSPGQLSLYLAAPWPTENGGGRVQPVSASTAPALPQPQASSHAAATAR